MGVLHPGRGFVSADILLLLASFRRTLPRTVQRPSCLAPCRFFSASRVHRDVGKAPETLSSVSQTEVSHFSRLASSWWDPHGPSRLLHLMNPLRHDFIQYCLQANPEPNISTRKYKYLDVGCGGGIFASSAARLPTTETVTAIDPTPSVIQTAQTHQRSDPALADPRLRYLNCAIEDVQEKEVAPADILTLFEVIEHVDSPTQFLRTCIPHIKPGGWLIGSTIARSPLSFLTTKVIAEAPIIGIVPRGTHDWNKYINPSELVDWFAVESNPSWGPLQTQGVVYIPGLGWKMVNGSESYGNYFFGVQRLP